MRIAASDYERLMRAALNEGIERAVVGMAIIRDGKLLLLRRQPDDFQPNLWELPGGHVEHGETLPEAIARELLEETGWALGKIIAPVDSFDYLGEKGKPTREWNFLVTADASGPLVHPEHQAYAWVTMENYRQYTMSPEMLRTVGRVLALALALPDGPEA